MSDTPERYDVHLYDRHGTCVFTLLDRCAESARAYAHTNRPYLGASYIVAHGKPVKFPPRRRKPYTPRYPSMKRPNPLARLKLANKWLAEGDITNARQLAQDTLEPEVWED